MTRSFFRHALLLTLAVQLSACHRSSSGGAATAAPAPDPLAVAALRSACTDAGITPLPPAPALRDELVALGQALYFDPLLSGSLDVSCATCHLPEFGTADGRTLPGGVGGLAAGPLRAGGAVIPRNSPSVLAAHLSSSMFHDSRVERLPGAGLRTPAAGQLTPEMQTVFAPGLELLAAQAMFPVTSRAEMRGEVGTSELGDLADGDLAEIWSALMDRLLAVPAYVRLFGDAYPGAGVTELSFAHAANAIAAFEVRAFAATDTPLDRFVRGDDLALDDRQLRGGIEFFGAAGCARCHSGSTFTDGGHHNIGLAQFGPGKGDGASGADDFGRERVTGLPRDRYRFRTPTLLNVELTAPYGHAGQFATLRDMVAHYVDAELSRRTYDVARNVDDPALIATVVDNEDDVLARLSPQLAGRRGFDVDAVVAFLGALTDGGARDLAGMVPGSVPSGLPPR